LLPGIDTLTNYPDEYSNGLIDLTVDLERKRWPDKFDSSEWGPNFREKTIPSVILDARN
jgi:hypothetical protein